MVNLTEGLVLARSRACDIESVRKLNCWGSDLSDVSILRRMNCVQVVSLSVNRINSLADFACCQNLEELYIRKNAIADLAEIVHLKQLPKLRVLWLSDNPCAVGDRYRMTVLKNLPNLQKLDNISVQDEETNMAIEQGMQLQLPEEDQANNQERVMDIDLERVVVSEIGDGDSGIVAQALIEQHHSNGQALSIEETNRIRAQLGLKALPTDKLSHAKVPTPPSFKDNQSSNILQAAICLVKELDADSLHVLSDAINTRLEYL